MAACDGRYGGLNTDKLEATHLIDPTKFILGTEACNCVGNVVFAKPNVAAWWTRAEKLALDILEDLRFWAVGWVDWNLLVDTAGGECHVALRTVEDRRPSGHDRRCATGAHLRISTGG